MIKDIEKAYSYVNKLRNNDKLLKEVEKYALENQIPIITSEVANFLKFIASLNKSKDILEIGTAIGYSGIILGRIAKENNGSLVTLEISKKMEEIANSNFKKAKLDNVNIIIGDAAETLDEIKKTFDFVFIDGAKSHYMKYFEKSFEKLKKGGIIVFDNILFRGYVYSEEYPGRYTKIVKSLNKLITTLHKNFDFVLLPFGDGIGIVKK